MLEAFFDYPLWFWIVFITFYHLQWMLFQFWNEMFEGHFLSKCVFVCAWKTGFFFFWNCKHPKSEPITRFCRTLYYIHLLLRSIDCTNFGFHTIGHTSHMAMFKRDVYIYIWMCIVCLFACCCFSFIRIAFHSFNGFSSPIQNHNSFDFIHSMCYLTDLKH